MTKQSNSNNRNSLLTHLTVAGSAALISTTANAQIIRVNVNQDVGYAAGDLASFTSALPGGNQFKLSRGNNSVGRSIDFNAVGSNVYNVQVRRTSVVIAVAPLGKTFNGVGTGAGGASIRQNATYTDQYFLFSFKSTTAGITKYGFIEAGLTDKTQANLNLHITAYAYDTSGAKIVTATATPAVPEPSAAIVLAAFSALTLGAVGVRRLKALRN